MKMVHTKKESRVKTESLNPREVVVQFLYQINMKGHNSFNQFEFEDLWDSFVENIDKVPSAVLFNARQVALNIANQYAEIISEIKKNSKKWKIERMSPVDLAILIIGVYEISFEKKLNPEIIISEAIKLTKKYSSENSYTFINGVLDAIGKTSRV